jgi:hypothetical protein
MWEYPLRETRWHDVSKDKEKDNMESAANHEDRLVHGQLGPLI